MLDEAPVRKLEELATLLQLAGLDCNIDSIYNEFCNIIDRQLECKKTTTVNKMPTIEKLGGTKSLVLQPKKLG